MQVELEVTTKDSGTTLRAPTSEAGLAPACKDTCFGDLKLQLWEKRYDGSKGKVQFVSHTYIYSISLQVDSNRCQLTLEIYIQIYIILSYLRIAAQTAANPLELMFTFTTSSCIN